MDLVNSIYDRPYAIVIDHKWQCVVVTIRGTLSLEDLIIDGTADAVRRRPWPSSCLSSIDICTAFSMSRRPWPLPCPAFSISMQTQPQPIFLINQQLAPYPGLMPPLQVPLDELGRAWGFPGEGQYAHGGILNSAECVVKVRQHPFRPSMIFGWTRGAHRPSAVTYGQLFVSRTPSHAVRSCFR